MLTLTKYFISHYTMTHYDETDTAVFNWKQDREAYDTKEEAMQWMHREERIWTDYIKSELATADNADCILHLNKLLKNSGYRVVAKTYNYTHISENMDTDVKAYEIVKVISDKTIEIRPMVAQHDISHLKQVSGGFSGHVVEQGNQKVTYESDETAPTFRIRKKKNGDDWTYKGGRFGLQEKPYAFYDFNF